MTEVTLSGGPLNGATVDVEAGQMEVEKDGCTYMHCEATGFYAYVGGEKASKPSRFRKAKTGDAED